MFNRLGGNDLWIAYSADGVGTGSGTSIQPSDAVDVTRLRTEKIDALDKLPDSIKSRINIGDGFIEVIDRKYRFVDNSSKYSQDTLPEDTVKADDFLVIKRSLDIDSDDDWNHLCFEVFWLKKNLKYRTSTPSTRRWDSVIEEVDGVVWLWVSPISESGREYPVIRYLK